MSIVFVDTLVISEVEDLLAVLDVASEYQIDGLLPLCEGALVRCADSDNACNLLLYAQQYALSSLRMVCVALIGSNFDTISASEDFEALEEDLKAEIKDLIAA